MGIPSTRRRVVFALALTAAAAAALAAWLAVGRSGGGAPSGSTLATTWVDRGGVLARGRGEPLVARTELARQSRPVRQLAVFAQLTDAHIVDEESPARLEMLDRLGPPFSSAFRPQEALSTQVLAAAVASVDRLQPQAVVVTGDLIDNDQQDELTQALAVLRGGRVDPNSGGPGYQGVQEASNPDPFYYRPDVDPPRHPGLLDTAERPFASPGLKAPWYPVVGNHDLLVQGNVAPTARTNAIAIGSRKLTALDPSALAAAAGQRLSPALVTSLLAHGLPGPSRRVAADPTRHELEPAQVLAQLRRASGHGGRGSLLDYAFDVAPGVRGLVLDTISRTGGASGVVRRAQVAWLRSALAAAGPRPVLLFTHSPLTSAAGGAAVLALLDRDPHVVAAIHGDAHRNEIAARRTPAGGYWLIGTSSLADWPQQARAFRLSRTADGGLVLQTWMLDTDPSNRLAAISRQLAFLDYQGGRPQRFAGTRPDRNASLYLPAPAP